MVILALNASLRRAVASSTDNNQLISWRKIEEEVAKDFHLRLNYVIELRKYFLENGVVVVIESASRGQGSQNAKQSSNQKVSKEMIKGVADYIDERHSEGKGVIANNIVAYLYDEFNVTIHQTYASQIVEKIGLSRTNIKSI